MFTINIKIIRFRYLKSFEIFQLRPQIQFFYRILGVAAFSPNIGQANGIDHIQIFITGQTQRHVKTLPGIGRFAFQQFNEGATARGDIRKFLQAQEILCISTSGLAMSGSWRIW